MKNLLIFTTFIDIVTVMHKQPLKSINSGFPNAEYEIGEFSAMCYGISDNVNSPNQDVNDH